MISNKIKLIIGLFLTLTFFLVPVKNLYAAPPADFQTTQIIGSGLFNPTGFELSPDGRIFILQQNGEVHIFKNNQLLPQLFTTVPVTQAGGDLGLLGITFDPDFLTNHYIYFYYTSLNGVNTVARYNALTDVATGSPTIIYESTIIAQEFHAGGTIQFGPDGKLYISIGDNQYPPNAQNLSNAAGKILRINKDGSVPTDNPFYGQSGKLPEIWAYGLRNPFRFQFDKSTGKLYLGDVGQASYEEINVIVKGGNYGWPTCEGGCAVGGLINPFFSYPHNSLSMSVTGGLVYNGTTFPALYQGSYIFGDYAAGFMKTIDIDNSGDFVGVQNFDLAAGSVVDLKEAPDGSIYYLTVYPGRLYQTTYTITDQFPVAISSSDISDGPEPLTVQFSSEGSIDPEGNTLSYNWNFGDGSFSNEPNPLKTFVNPGRFIVNLTVSDGINEAQAVPLIIQAGTPPSLEITQPITDSNYNAGDFINYNASATDSEGNTLPENSFRTEIIFHHLTHTHPFLIRESNNSGNFEVPKTGENSPETYYEIKISATDTNGLITAKSVNIFPVKSNLTFNTLPSNLNIFVDSELINTPYTIESVAGFERELNTPEIQQLGGVYYQFDSWSVGGNQKQFYSTPESDTTITATFKSVSSATGQFITSFTLINADTDQVIETFDPLENGETINLDSLPTSNLNIRANTFPASVGSVRFGLDTNSNFRMENYAPYALASDEESDFYPWTPSLGSHTLTATPYTGQNGSGVAGAILTVSINVIRDGSATPTPTPTPSTTPSPSTSATPTASPVSGNQVVSYSLINADTDQIINEFNPIPENAILNLQTLPTQNLNIRANTNPGVVGSVRFALNANANFRTEGYAPYALGSDEDGNYNPWTPVVGSYTLTSTPYTLQNALGTAGHSLTLNFTVINQAATPSSTPTVNPTVSPTTSITPTPTPTSTATPTPTPYSSSTPTPTPSGQFVTSFTLINADTDLPISGFDPILDNAVIKLSDLPTANLNIRANINPAVVGSVKFGLDTNSNFRLENTAPYALAGDESGNYNLWTPTLGQHTITAQPFSSGGAAGTAGTSLIRTFTIEE